jgi:hypothetical protein
MKGHIRERSPGHWAIVIDVRMFRQISGRPRVRSTFPWTWTSPEQK